MLKEEYVSPAFVNADTHELVRVDEKSDGWAPAMLAGYAAARVVTNAMKAAPSVQLPAINNR